MAYQRINLDTWPRRPHFDLFDTMAHPWLDICCSVDATTAWSICSATGGPSFSAASLFPAIGAVIHFSVVPWLNFTAIGHPRDRNTFSSVPKIVIGKCHLQGSRWLLPVAVSAHHGLVDGLHAARFFDHLQQRLDQAATLLAS